MGFGVVQLREVIRILRGFDLGGCSMFHCILEREVDVSVVLMLLCKPGLRPGFSGIEDGVVLFLSPALYLLFSSIYTTL